MATTRVDSKVLDANKEDLKEAIGLVDVSEEDATALTSTQTGSWSPERVGLAINTKINALIDGAPSDLNTLNAIAAAIDNDPNFVSTITTLLASKLSNTWAGGDTDWLPDYGDGGEANADTLSTPGFYKAPDTWVGSPFPNQDGKNQGYLSHFYGYPDHNFALQTHTQLNSGQISRFRTMQSGVWQDWVTIWNSSNDADLKDLANATGTLPDARLSYAVINKPENSIGGDWNNLTTPGWQAGIIRGDSLNANGPPGDIYYHVYVLQYQTNQFLQIAYPYAGNTYAGDPPIMRRAQTSNGSWSNWKPVGSTPVGTVSQVNGIPTGAIMQRGNNANGDYVRFADGTQICRISSLSGDVTTATGNIFRTNSEAVWTFPASFVDTNYIVTGGTYGNSQTHWVSARAGSVSQAAYTIYAPASATGRPITLMAVGRWY